MTSICQRYDVDPDEVVNELADFSVTYRLLCSNSSSSINSEHNCPDDDGVQLQRVLEDTLRAYAMMHVQYPHPVMVSMYSPR